MSPRTGGSCFGLHFAAARSRLRAAMTEGPETVDKPSTVVIGAGIVGVCAALHLLRDGRRVTLVDRGAPGEGTSFGNAAVLAVESVVPVQSPGMIRRVPGMLTDPLGPLAIRWGYLPRLAPWLARFLAASTPARVERASIALAALHEGVVEAYGPLTEMAGCGDMIQRRGWVGVYETEAGFRSAQGAMELQRQRGVALEVLEPEELRQLEPALSRDLVKGVYYPGVAHVTDNFRLVRELAGALERHGGTILRAEARGFELGEGGVRAVLTDRGREPCDAVVVAAGAWSRPLARRLGSDPPLDTERGYHLHVPEPGVAPRMPLYSYERAFACTPLENGLRLAGTVELGGLEAPPDWRRAEVLGEHARRFLPGLKTAAASRWMGFRPSMPDSVPVISASPRHANAFFAFGHGHCGLTSGARTGRIVADLAAGRDPGLDMTPYRIDRF